MQKNQVNFTIVKFEYTKTETVKMTNFKGNNKDIVDTITNNIWKSHIQSMIREGKL